MTDIITIPDDALVYSIVIDLYDKATTETVYSKQYEINSRYIVVTLENNGVHYPITNDKTIVFCATKKDGKGIYNYSGLDSNGNIVYRITDQTTSVSGLFDAEFRILNPDSTQLITTKFRMYVEESALKDTTIISTDEFGILATTLVAIKNIEASENDRITAENLRITKENERLENEAERVANDEVRPIWHYVTQSQYDALTPEQKADTKHIYQITDNQDSDLVDELQILIDATNTAKVAAENVSLQKNGINDATINTIETWSSDKITKRIRTATYTASGTVSTIPHNLNFVASTDELIAIVSGVILEYSDNYTHSVDYKSIILNGWTIASGTKVYFRLYKNVK